MYQPSYRMLPITDHPRRCLDMELGQRDRHIQKSFFQYNALFPDLSQILSAAAVISPRSRSNLGKSIHMAVTEQGSDRTLEIMIVVRRPPERAVRRPGQDDTRGVSG